MFNIYLHWNNIELFSTYIPDGKSNYNLPMDPVRWCNFFISPFLFVIEKILSIGFFSFIFNSLLLILIKQNFLGSKLKNILENISKSKKNAIVFLINYFLFVYIFIFTVKYNMNTIYTDSVTYNLTLDNMDISITGDLLSIIKNVTADTTIFLGSARLATFILSKNTALHGLSKIGIMLATGGGGLITYRVVDRTLANMGFEKATPVAQGVLNLKSSNELPEANSKLIEELSINSLFGSNSGVSNISIQPQLNILKQDGILQLNTEESSKIIKALDSSNPNWKSEFSNNFIINSPFENDSNLLNHLIDSLTDHLYLGVICFYLLFVLLIFLICKFLISPNIEFQRLSKIKIFNWPLGQYLSNFIIKIISIWQKSSSIWIFFIMLSLIVFNGVTIFSTYFLLKILKNIS